MSERQFVAVLVTQPEPGHIEVVTDTGDHWESIAVATSKQGWPDTAEAGQQLEAAGYSPANQSGTWSWRNDKRGYAVEVVRR